MRLEDTKIHLQLGQDSSLTFQNLSIALLGTYLGCDNNLVIDPAGQSQSLLDTPGCVTENVWVSGVANTARHLLTLRDPAHPLLGHHAGCLSGRKEVSPWTHIVEVSLPGNLAGAGTLAGINNSLVFLEKYLAAPFIGHNERKVRQEAITLGLLPQHGLQSKMEWKALPVIRRYVHGLHLGATDILIYGMVIAKLFLHGYSRSDLSCSELLGKWFDRLDGHCDLAIPAFFATIKGNLLTISDSDFCTQIRDSTVESAETNSKAVPKESTDLSYLDSLVSNVDTTLNYYEIEDVPVDWDGMSDLLKPQRHSQNNIPKMQQLQSMLGGVRLCVKRAKSALSPDSAIRIVDFCSGGGHLGIFIAHNFPGCEVILVETKWGSLRFAKERIDELGLENVTLCLAHMGQFRGSFEIGVSLHACGSATDYVLAQCIRNNASIVSSPCCYGKIENSQQVTYPKSVKVNKVVDNPEDYFHLSRLADHESQNENFMKTVDFDRVEHLKETGYMFAVISKLKPLNCSPKNNLIVAVK